MVKRYPHILQFKSAPTEAYQDEQKRWVPGIAGNDINLPCRYEPNGQMKTVILSDGRSVVYEGKVFIPKNIIRVDISDTINVRIYNNGALIINNKILQFFEGQSYRVLYL